VTEEGGRRHILTVAVEDWFQVGSFHRLVQEGRWYRFETRVERNVHRALDLLETHGATATFFTLGWIADELPELVREIADRGHEVASKGYYHRSMRAMTPDEFRDDLARSREALERASGTRVRGYRVADEWFRPHDLWALDVLQREGFAYDSSIYPMFREWREDPHRRFAHEQAAGDGRLWELPLSTVRCAGLNLPVAGGNWYRQLPHGLMQAAFRRWMRTTSSPFVMYFQVWELDPEQPRLGAASTLTRLRHYRNLGKLAWALPDYLRGNRFVSAADWLGLGREETAASVSPAGPGHATESALAPAAITRERTGAVAGQAACGASRGPGTPVTVVVPCYNEELVLPYLARTLAAVEKRLADAYDLRWVFVDDASTDGTRAALRELFGDRPDTRIVAHETNRGVARAILTGVEAAGTEIVASIDCDCTYDPNQLADLVPLLADADLVTASPYHPRGEVRNVPEWRLVLSRGLSGLYRLVLRSRLHTYTSCFRAYRRSAVVDLPIREGGFLGVAETLGVLDLRGYRIVECPAVLEVRMLGRSKMKVLKTMAGHLRLLARLAFARLAGGARERRPLPLADALTVAPVRHQQGVARPEGSPHE
jgi:polysaccharide deacetylase family protein (PEP-CTERM system associated)